MPFVEFADTRPACLRQCSRMTEHPVIWTDSAEPAAVWSSLAPRVKSDAVILLKGSRGVRLEQLVPAIEEWSKSKR